MLWTDEQLDRIFQRTRGRCHLCWKALTQTNYGRLKRRGAWEVDHSRPRARGGTDHRNNLFAACISCNRSKRHGANATIRSRYGRTRAPMSPTEYEAAKRGAAASWSIASIVAACALGMTGGGAVLVATLVGLLVYGDDPEE